MANQIRIKHQARARRRHHIRKTVHGTTERPRLVVFRSNKQIYAQIIDDDAQKTLIAASSMTNEIEAHIKKAKTKIEKSKVVGKHIAELAQKKKITAVVFDRAGYLYHGRVQALAEGAREGGLKF